MSFPISRGEFINLIGFVTVPDGEGGKLEGPSVKDVPTDEMIENYLSTWEPEIKQLMSVSSFNIMIILLVIFRSPEVREKIIKVGDSPCAEFAPICLWPSSSHG